MATKEELEAQNAALREELEEEKKRSAMDQNVWNSNLPSPRENRERVQKRRGYEQAAVSALQGAQPDSSVAESSVAADVEKELERLRKENEELKTSKEDESKTEDSSGEEKPAKKTASSKKNFS